MRNLFRVGLRLPDQRRQFPGNSAAEGERQLCARSGHSSIEDYGILGAWRSLGNCHTSAETTGLPVLMVGNRALFLKDNFSCWQTVAHWRLAAWEAACGGIAGRPLGSRNPAHRSQCCAAFSALCLWSRRLISSDRWAVAAAAFAHDWRNRHIARRYLDLASGRERHPLPNVQIREVH
jgi:hypothetical protein